MIFARALDYSLINSFVRSVTSCWRDALASVAAAYIPHPVNNDATDYQLRNARGKLNCMRCKVELVTSCANINNHGRGERSLVLCCLLSRLVG